MPCAGKERKTRGQRAIGHGGATGCCGNVVVLGASARVQRRFLRGRRHIAILRLSVPPACRFFLLPLPPLPTPCPPFPQVSPCSLNKLSHQAAVHLIQEALDAGVNVTNVYVDTVGDPARYQEYLENVFYRRIAFTVTSKADSLYPVVSAASIVAKVARDYLLENWQFPETRMAGRTHELGCGYPGACLCSGRRRRRRW